MSHTVAVNLSARQFQFQDLASTVEEILVETGCRAEWLGLEITESLLLEEDDVDDFGTGYSALSYLARFPIDVLKIDRSFVQKVTTDRRHAELVKAILSIARCLGQQVVAEGVETDAQAAFLWANGCQIAQGFLYSEPLPKARITSLPRCLGGFLKLDA
jgi:EAL domain-containing protein (putative c-di-GMP-specific phosphodiesterase class I)